MTNTATAQNLRPIIVDDGNHIDPLATYATVRITTRQLREGMILVDDLGCPVYLLDQRVATNPRGHVSWMAHDLEYGGYMEIRPGVVSRIPNVSVAAA